jgi:hypothetical protein
VRLVSRAATRLLRNVNVAAGGQLPTKDGLSFKKAIYCVDLLGVFLSINVPVFFSLVGCMMRANWYPKFSITMHQVHPEGPIQGKHAPVGSFLTVRGPS